MLWQGRVLQSVNRYMASYRQLQEVAYLLRRAPRFGTGDEPFSKSRAINHLSW